MASYDFDTQLSKGQEHEATLDRYFARWYVVEPVSRELQRLGIDRLFTDKQSGKRWSVEYKADDTAARTGHAFIETVSVDIAHKRGWAYSSIANLIVYYVPPQGIAYVLSTERLKGSLDALGEYETKDVPNQRNGEAYITSGIVVPLTDLQPWLVSQLIVRQEAAEMVR